MNFSWRMFLRSIVLPIVIGMLLGSVFIVIFEEQMIYFPSKYPDGYWEPERFGLTVEDCYFTTADNLRLHGWFIPSDKARATVLWCHGNAGNISHRIDLAKKLLQLNVNVFIFDYRGYGRSEGEPSEEGLYHDVVAAHDYLLTRHDVDSHRIVAYGQSLGSAVAVDLATKRRCKALIIEATFSSGSDVAKSLFWWLPIHPFIRSRFDSYSKIKTLHLPTLFIHGQQDRTIPISLGEKLFEAANEPKWFYKIPNADHNDTYIVGGEEYFRRIDEFLAKNLAP